ncbi:hypothetical protein P879_00128 [Paragonimus westermani]|uniref:Uncharacterized protein n=1 Tax=Paragonimus westermani TaxID=34504 RepID=A0A8T0DZ73_9TREM|nr:hypothetical protein P879_00128 [Paragonimus westermani]
MIVINSSTIRMDSTYWVVTLLAYQFGRIVFLPLTDKRQQCEHVREQHDLLAEKVRYKDLSGELDQTFAELTGY